MRIDSEQVRQHLERRLDSLYTIYGEEGVLALEAADRIRAHARAAGHSEREVLSVESGFDWSALAMSGNSLSLFAARRILELHIASGKPGVEGAEAIKRYVADLPPDTVTLVLLPKLDKATLASGWFEALDAAGVTVAANPVSAGRLPQWLAGRLAQQDQQADPDALQFLADMVEGNLFAARQEVQKLALLFPPGRLTREAVEPAVVDVARYDVFKLGEALLSGERARFVRMLEGLKSEGVAPPLILWAIAEEIRALLRVSSAVSQRRPMQIALREARVWGARADLLPQALRRLQPAEVEEALLHAAAVDRVSKGLVRGDVWEELLRLGLRLMPAPPARPTRENRGKLAG